VSKRIPIIVVEHRLEKPLAAALLKPVATEVYDAGTTSGAVGHAMGFLLDEPQRPVVLLIGTRTDNERTIGTDRGAAQRLLATCSLTGWHVAMAIPRLDAWARTDPRIDRDLTAKFPGASLYVDRLARIAELLKTAPLDTTNLLKTNAEYRGLMAFLRQHSPDTPESAQQVAVG
jgi:hypothetical protein